MSQQAEREDAFFSQMTGSAWVERAKAENGGFRLQIGLRRNLRGAAEGRFALFWRESEAPVAEPIAPISIATEPGRVVLDFHLPAAIMAAHDDPLRLTSVLIDCRIALPDDRVVRIDLPPFLRELAVDSGHRTVGMRPAYTGRLTFRSSRRLGSLPGRTFKPGAKKIMVFANQVYFGGGKTKAIFQLARELAAMGHDVRVTSLWFGNKAPKFRFPDEVGFDFIDGTYKTQASDPEAGTSAFSAVNNNVTRATDARLATYLATNHFDLIYMPNYDSEIYRVFRDNVSPDTRIVLGDHNPRRPEQAVAGEVDPNFLFGMRAFDAVHTVNPLIADLLQPLTPKPVFAIPNMVDKAEPVRRDEAFFATRKLISIGRLTGTKRMHHVIDAFAMIADQFPEWSLDIFGEGPDMEKLVAQVSKRKRTDRIHLRGFDPAVTEILADGAVFVSGSAAEAHPLVLIESMVAGCPIVSYDRQWGAKYLIRDGENGYLAADADKKALADAIARVFTLIQDRDPSVLEVIRRAGDACAEFARPRIAGLWADKVEELCAAKG